jgi:hypothetical protein
MISRKFLLLCFIVLNSSGANATSEDSCTFIEKSASRGKAVVSESSIFVAVNAADVSNSKTKSSKDVKQKLQMMFVEYCRNFSGYKYFQITTKEGVSGSVKCDGKTFYAFSVKKSNILISQLTSSNVESVLDIPELNDQKDVFEEFR